MRTGSIDLTIDSQFQHVFLVGSAVQRICSWIPLSAQSAFEMEMAVVEAVNNSIEHACHNQSGHPITTRMNLSEGRITFVITDAGDAVTRLPEMPALDDHIGGAPERGRGLQIMRAVMDEVAYTTDGISNFLTMVKYLPIVRTDGV
jgi:anti-sigma regulatory factor (Ser/Thr protein kinase)